MNINPPNWYPVYKLEPADIPTLTEQCWDTLRVLVCVDTDDLYVASGYGNTHANMVECIKRHLKGVRRPQFDDSIVYFERNTAYLNDTCSGRGENIRCTQWLSVFSEKNRSLLEVTCMERGLKLT